MEALRNIVQNAVDAMPTGGKLRLTSALVDGFVELSISDTGEGIAPEHLEDIFQLYFTTKEDGNGVGLPLALRAVDLHGGTLNIESKLNQGTSVRIRLPLEDRALRPRRGHQCQLGLPFGELTTWTFAREDRKVE